CLWPQPKRELRMTTWSNRSYSRRSIARVALHGWSQRSECDAILGKKATISSSGATKESVEGSARREGSEGSRPGKNSQTESPCSKGRTGDRCGARGMVHRDGYAIFRSCSPNVIGD